MSSKKRKTPTEIPQSAASPVSAIAARRRLAEPVAAENDDEEVIVPHSLTPSNAFSALRGLKRIDSSSPLPLKKSVPVVPAATGERVSGSPVVSASLAKRDEILAQVAAPKSVAPYSSFVLNKRNSATLPSGGLELRLPDGERFMAAGIFGITVLTGHITVQGASFRAGDDVHWVHASYVHAIPVIRTHQETTVHLLSDKTSYGLQRLGRLSPFYAQLWRKGSEERVSGDARRTFEMLLSSDDAPKRGLVQELISPPVWNKKLADLALLADKTGNLSTLICGPKSSGKSTMSRLLVNRLLNRGGQRTFGTKALDSRAVAVIDIDPGQPEYGPPGTLSLLRVTRPNLGAPFSHPGISDPTYTVLRSHALASVTPASNPALYRQCAIALYETYKAELPGRPLIINTPGWIQGTGLELLSDIIDHINPHEVLYMSEEGPAESVDALREVTKREFTTLPSQPAEFTSRTAAELREMQSLSYFHIQSESSETPKAPLRWSDRPLSHTKPCLIPYSGKKSILGVLSYDYQAPPELLADSINGMVLALVGIEGPAAFGDFALDPSTKLPQIGRTPEGIPYIANPTDIALDPRYSHLLGLVLVRGVDAKQQCLQGLSPVLGETLDRLNDYSGNVVLVHGNFGCPNWAYTEPLYYSQAKDSGVEEDEPAVTGAAAAGPVPWVEVLEGNQSRPVGSKRWRVRRDLGRAA